ncbi:hypothetical protein M9H77_18030 [Catharanthus roseus]|uniref:Uncharacterized protein n=1 Tax=Catharanthus roseus TaxID=4058 RepID=A0ACC0B693_CATRO|nr:hypothetical protein M9H77_18030 [Catharanthus roseus]
MVKVKNANVGRGENYEEGGIERWKKGKREESGKKRRKITPGHRVDLSNVGGMEIIPNLFENIGWGPLLIVNELYYPEIIYEFYANLHKRRVQKLDDVTHQWVTFTVGSRDISFDDRMLNTILGTPENGIRNALIPTFGDYIGIRKIYNKHTFKRMGFSRTDEGMLVRGGQEDDDESDEEEDEGQDAINVDEEVSERPEEETFRREMRQKKRQEKVEEG